MDILKLWYFFKDAPYKISYKVILDSMLGISMSNNLKLSIKLEIIHIWHT